MTLESDDPLDYLNDGSLEDNIITKTSSTGPDMIARRKEERGREYDDPSLLFGVEFLDSYEYSHRRGASFDADFKNLPRPIVSDRVKSQGRKLTSRRDALHAVLAKLTTTRQGEKSVMDFFQDYFMQISESDRDAMAKNL